MILLVVISRRIVLTRRVVPSLALRRFVSPHASLRRSCHRHRIASSPPRLTCLVVAVSCVTLLSCQHPPSPHCVGWLLCLSPLPLAVAVSCVASSPLTRRAVAALPHLSHRCIALCSSVALLPSLVSHHVLPLPSCRCHLLRCVTLSTSHLTSLVASTHPSFPVVVVAFVRV